MATRSLGTLTLDLIAKIGGFTAGLNEAERAAEKTQRQIADNAKRRAAAFSGAWNTASGVVAGALAGISFGAVLSKFISETIDAQNEQAQLAAVLKSTGQAAGFTQQQLNDMADEMSAILPDTGAINQAQAVLLKYTNIVGVQFTKALETAGDMSARTGKQFAETAQLIGKALNAPGEGLAKLRAEGVNFSDSQVFALQKLTEMGRAAEAQTIILDELERSFGGAAKAARETLAGSLQALQEALNTVLTGDDDSVGAMRAAIEDLTKTLSSPETKAAFANIVIALATIVQYTAKAITGIVNFTQTFSQDFARAFNGATEPAERLNEDIKSLQDNIKILQKSLVGVPANSKAEWVLETLNRIAQLKAELNDAIKSRDNLTRAPIGGGTPGGGGGAAAPATTKQDLDAIAARFRAQEAAAKAAAEGIKQADAYISRLKDQVDQVNQLTTLEKVNKEIREGSLKAANASQQVILRDLAKQIDDEKAWQKFKRETIDLYREEGREREKVAAERASGREFAQGIIADSNPISRMDADLKAQSERLAKAAEIDQENLELYAMARVELERKTQEKIAELQAQALAKKREQQQVEFNMIQGIFNDLTTITEGFAGSQSKLYKVMFEASKGFAIAQSIVKIQQGIADAASLPWPQNLAAMASVVAATASIVSTIKGTNMGSGRAGGGYVHDGTAYPVGEMGPEMFVPKTPGYIIPNSVLRNSGRGGGNMNVTVSMQGQQGVSRDTLMQQGVTIGSGIQRALARNA